jgi:SAM-dependent methyltransferase
VNRALRVDLEHHPVEHLADIIGNLENKSVLDVGCGYRSALSFAGAHVTGIDVSVDALQMNSSVDEHIIGDIQTVRLPEQHFDVVYCWNLLEHLPFPNRALSNMARALKPDGMLVLGLPNVISTKGLVTKFTPHRFHVWFYRRIKNSPRAGLPGYGPFKTYLRWSLRPRTLRASLERLGFDIEHFEPYSEDWVERSLRGHALLCLLWRSLSLALRPFGITALSDIAIVARRRI